MMLPRHADPASLPWLDFVAMGGQSRVFGTPAWVVKIPRASWQSALGRILVHPTTPWRALETLGEWVEPFVVMERVAFRGPRVTEGRPVPSSHRVWRARWAVASPRLAAEDFLDRRIAAATPREAADLIASLLDTLDAIRARGWHVLDFIMSNFVVRGAHHVRLVDTGLLIPASHLRGPSQQVCSRLFLRRMVPDYRAVLTAVAARHPEDEIGRARLQAVIETLGPRLADWRAGRVVATASPSPSASASLAPLLEAEIFRAWGPVRRKLPLTPRPPSGYTPTHHAITSEN